MMACLSAPVVGLIIFISIIHKLLHVHRDILQLKAYLCIAGYDVLPWNLFKVSMRGSLCQKKTVLQGANRSRSRAGARICNATDAAF